MLFMITFGSKERNEDNSKLVNTLKTCKYWWNHIPNVWIIGTDETLEYWLEYLKANNENDTSFLIVDITNSKRRGWLPRDAWDWFKDRNF